MSKPKYSLNRSYFNKINSHNKAYFFGFLMADGYNHVSKREVIVGQTEDKKDIIYKLQKEINSSCPIKIRKRNNNQQIFYELSLYSVEISKDLERHGMIQCKTHKTKFPKINKKYINSFILGYFDGDGSISFFEKNYNNSSINFTGNDELILEIKNIIDLKFKKNGYVYARHKDVSNIITLAYTGKQSCKLILDWLYKNSGLYLNKKYNAYLKLKNLLQEKKLRKINRLKIKKDKIIFENKIKQEKIKENKKIDKEILKLLKCGYSIRQIRRKFKKNAFYIRKIINVNNINYGKRKRMFAKQPINF